jgi:hypothetical protein
MTATIIRMSVQRMVCTDCGAETNASCNCGVSYVPKAIRAAEAIRAHPEKSNRMIAEETGLSEPTIRRARQTASDDAVEEIRIGLDGKTRRVPQRPESEEITPKEKKQAFMIFAFEAKQLANYDGPVDAEVTSQAEQTAEAWRLLTQTLKEKYRG